MMNTVWIVIGVIYLIITLVSFYLAYKSYKKYNLEKIELNVLPTESFEPKENTGFYSSATITSKGVESETRSKVFVDIVKHFNQQLIGFQDFINKTTLQKLQEYIDNKHRINMIGYIAAGIVSLIATITAFLSAYLN